MKRFFSIHDVSDIHTLIEKALINKKHPFANDDIGRRKTIGLLFFNSSLRTRLSSQKAAQNLGMNIMVINAGTESWKMEFGDGTVMGGTTVEHIKEGAAVLGEYVDIIGVRAFAELADRDKDYAEEVIHKVEQYSQKPVISLESATRHPLQSFADMITIREIMGERKPKVAVTWAPHPKALPQAVTNSFLEWCKAYGSEITLTHPEGYELSSEFTDGVHIEYDQEKALENADIVYAKNWSAYNEYGAVLRTDREWMVTAKKMARTNNAAFLHCLPTRRNFEISDDVLDSEYSRVIQQAGNRIWAAQTVISEILQSNVQR